MGSDPPGEASDEEGIVRPEDLDFTRDERVATLREGRYVVATGGSGPPSPGSIGDDTDDEDEGDAPSETRSPGDILRELGDELDAVDQPHGFALAGRFDGEISRRAVLSDDLPAMFDDLLTWTASNVDDDTSPEAIIGILLLASGRTVRFPARTFDALVDAHGLAYDDSIGELAERLAEDGFRVPPSNADE